MADTPRWDTTTETVTTSSVSPAPGPAFALLGTVQISLLFALTALIVPLPRIGRAFSLDRADLILLSSAYGLSFSGLLLLGGRVADRFGGRRALTAGLLVFGAASLAALLAP
ncbi:MULTISPECIES: MFS transporter, partial [unclassified Streptomyces]